MVHTIRALSITQSMIKNSDYFKYLPPTLHHLPRRAHPLDGKLLLFERDTGLNVLLEGEETAHFQRLAPRAGTAGADGIGVR